MQRAKSLMEIWPWLPAFRTVVETQQLSTAAEMLGVTRAALSRTISKLERNLGIKLFDRVNRGMLPTAGAGLLAHHTREAMRHLDDALAQLPSTQRTARWIRLAFDGQAVGALIHRALPRLSWREIHLNVEVAPVSKMAGALLAGDLDLGLATSPSNDERVLCKPLLEVPCRWVTLSSTLELPPTGLSERLRVPQTLGIPTTQLLRRVCFLLPNCVPLPPSCRTLTAPPITLWRITRTRPEKSLIELAARIGFVSIKARHRTV